MGHDRGKDGPREIAETTFTRRGLLELAGLAVVTAALPGGAAAARPSRIPSQSEPGISPVMNKLSTYMSEAGTRALPEEVVEKTKQHILDTFAAMISGSELVPGRNAIQFARSYGGEKVSTVAASDILCGPIEAALVNGMLAHSDETDDSQAPSQSHPGCAVVPAALAAAERFGISGTHFMRGVTLGYDIGTRFTMTLGGQKFEAETHWSTHSISPLFGATAAAGCAANLNAQQMRWLLGYSAQQSSGLAAWHRDTQHIQKAFVFAGMNARSGVTSALLVHAGWTGVEDILSGPDNFFLAYNPHADPGGLIEKLGERYEITRTNIKKWPVGSPIQAVLDAVDILRKQHHFDTSDVQKVTVQLATDEAAIVNNREMPDICLQHMLAVMLLDMTVSFRSAHDAARMKDLSVLRERAKVKLVPDQQLERLMPLRVAIVEVTLAGGSRLTQRVANVRGTPENPMSRDEVVTKASDLISPILGATTCRKLVEKVLNLEVVKDVHELRPLLQRS
ncbi:MAG: MmgE/PrpD family protein [Candidatus Acidiferrales bacterium]